jgi:hypothetical protein
VNFTNVSREADVPCTGAAGKEFGSMNRIAIGVALFSLAALPALAAGPRKRPDRGPEVGAAAPDFDLCRLDNEGRPDEENKVQLSSFRNEKLVVLIFGSYT